MRGSTDAGEGSRHQYRLYFVDGAGRVASPPHEFEAVDDATAIRLAEAWREGRRLELWSGARKIVGG